MNEEQQLDLSKSGDTDLKEAKDMQDIAELCDLIKLEEFDPTATAEKQTLVNPSPERIQQLTAQMKNRLDEGQGETFWEVGYDEGGFPKGVSEEELKESLKTLEELAKANSAIVSSVIENKAENGRVAQVLIRQYTDDVCMDLRIAVCGNVDSGKSTLVSVLTRGVFDNGRGSSRASIFQHKHEIDTGRTSSISMQTLGFDEKGNVVNYTDNNCVSEDLLKSSKKLLTFIDLAGHEKYLKTTVSGLTGQQPDYALLLIGSNMGITRMTKEHLGIALALKIPIIVLITKIDMCPQNVLQETLQNLYKVLKLPGVKKMPILVKNVNDAMTCIKSDSERICPIFLISNVSGKNIDLLKQYLNFLPVKKDWRPNDPTEVVIDGDYYITGVGTVVSGTVISGVVKPNCTLLLGPDANGQYIPVQVKTIQTKRVPVNSVSAGQSAAMAIKKIKRKMIRKGMVLVDPILNPESYWEFDVDLLVLYHSTTIKTGYQPVVHCVTVRQSATLIHISDKDVLRTGDRALCRFRFLFRPEYVKTKARLIFREGRTKCVGTLVAVYKDASPPPVAVADPPANAGSQNKT